jgi:hypothetical protein
MNKSIIGAVLVLLVAAIIGAVVLSSGEDNTDSSNNESTSQSSDNIEPEIIDQISLETVQMHAEESDCWTIINGNVYDITSYVPRHPGGDEILRACGADGTSLFTSRTTDEGEKVGSGTAHSGSATSQLQSLFIGQLAD